MNYNLKENYYFLNENNVSPTKKPYAYYDDAQSVYNGLINQAVNANGSSFYKEISPIESSMLLNQENYAAPNTYSNHDLDFSYSYSVHSNNSSSSSSNYLASTPIEILPSTNLNNSYIYPCLSSNSGNEILRPRGSYNSMLYKCATDGTQHNFEPNQDKGANNLANKIDDDSNYFMTNTYHNPSTFNY